MLARQTFKQSWANPKAQAKAKAVQSDEMIIDTPVATVENEDLKAEIQRGDAAKDVAGNEPSKVHPNRKAGMRAPKPYTMPIFGFQRQGIGIEDF